MRELSSRLLPLTVILGLTLAPTEAVAAGDPRAVLTDLQSKDREICLRAMKDLEANLFKDKQVQAVLVKLLSHIDEEIGLNAALTLSKGGEPFIAALRVHLVHEDEVVRYRSLTALGAMAAVAKPVRADIFTRLKDEDEDVRGKAVFALAKIVPEDAEVHRAVLAAMKDSSRAVRFHAWQAASEIGMPIYPALERLVLNGDQSPAVFAAIGEIVEKNKGQEKIKPIARLVPKVASLLVDGDFPYNSRWSAWRILGNFHAESAPLLLKNLRQVDLPQRDDCSAVLRIIAKELAKGDKDQALQGSIFEAMRDRLTDHDVMVAQSANNYFFEHPDKARLAEAQYRTLLRHPDSMRRDWASRKLTSWGFNPANDAWDKYQSAKGDDKLRAACEWSLVGFSPFKPEVGALLQKNIEHPNAELRYEIVRVLYREEFVRGSIEEKDRLAVTTLLMQRIKDKDEKVRYDAVRKLVKYGLPRKELGPDLTPLLADVHGGVRYYACEALKPCVSAEPKKYVPPLVKMLNDPQSSVRMVAVKSLGAGGKGALDPLLDALRKRSTESYWICAELPSLGASAQAALPLLAELTLTKDKIDYRTSARRALAKIDPEFAARVARDALVKNPQFRDFPAVKTWRDVDAELLKMAADEDSQKATQALQAWSHFFWCLHYNHSDADPLPLWTKLLPSLRKNLTAKEAKDRRRTVLAIVSFVDARLGEGRTLPWFTIHEDIDRLLKSCRHDEDLLVRRAIRKALDNNPHRYYGI